jgi:hypothetical protein
LPCREALLSERVDPCGDRGIALVDLREPMPSIGREGKA